MGFMEDAWNGAPQRVRVPYVGLIAALSRYPSTTSHEEACGNPGGPPPKAKYTLPPIVNQYREGKVKSTPGGE